jgi:ribosome recycling factor
MSISQEVAKKKFEETVEHLKSEFSTIRAGRSNPKLVEDIRVDAYGQKMPMNQVAGISTPDPTLIVIQPWDKSIVGEIEKSIRNANIGIEPLIDGDTIRLPIPPLTEERRKEFVKLMKNKLEEARIAIRQIRKDAMDYLDDQKDNKGMSEDVHEMEAKKLQELVDKTNDKLEEVGKEKEKELLTV